MFNLFSGLPSGFAMVFNFIVAVICCYLFLWIFTWMQWFCSQHSFLPWPH